MTKVYLFCGYTLVTLAAVDYGLIMERNRNLDSLSIGTMIGAFVLTSASIVSSCKLSFILTFLSV